MLVIPLLQAAEHDVLSSFLFMMQGEFRTEPGGADGLMIDRRVMVEAPGMGKHAMYLQINTGQDLSVYRQRLLLFTLDERTGKIHQETWGFRQPEAFVDAFNAPALFSQLKAGDLELKLPDGCDQVWTQIEDGWSGVVDPATCRIWSDRRQAWRHIGAESRLSPGYLMQAERGFDNDGVQVFGTPEGEFLELHRVKNQNPSQ